MPGIAELARDWRFAASALLAGVYIGKWFYKVAPPPPAARAYFEEMVRAGVAGMAAKDLGIRGLERMANVVGASAMGELQVLLRRQRRICVVWGIVFGAVLSALLCSLTSILNLPDWAFLAFAAVGLYQAWRLW